MSIGTGITLAFVAMLSWGVGDFLIQRTTRKLGDWETLFAITAFGTVVLMPFVWREAAALVASGPTTDLLVLLSCALVLTAAALFNFEGFKSGKIAVLEPLQSLEIIAASFFSIAILGDRVTPLQGGTIAALITFLILVSFRGGKLRTRWYMEKGVIIYAIGAVLMGVADFFLGWGARLTDPVLANFVLNLTMTVVAGAALLLDGRMRRLGRDVRANAGVILVMSIADNAAWLAYAFAMSYIPIAVATGLSESSIIVAVALGLIVSKEKLQKHQKVGLVGAIACALLLASLTAS